MKVGHFTKQTPKSREQGWPPNHHPIRCANHELRTPLVHQHLKPSPLSNTFGRRPIVAPVSAAITQAAPASSSSIFSASPARPRSSGGLPGRPTRAGGSVGSVLLRTSARAARRARARQRERGACDAGAPACTPPSWRSCRRMADASWKMPSPAAANRERPAATRPGRFVCPRPLPQHQPPGGRARAVGAVIDHVGFEAP